MPQKMNMILTLSQPRPPMKPVAIARPGPRTVNNVSTSPQATTQATTRHTLLVNTQSVRRGNMNGIFAAKGRSYG
jgi:hypothetical protein